MTSSLDVLTPCILVVDDEKQIHSSLRLRLGENYRLSCIANPREALDLVRRQHFDLCIVDIRMPGMDGLSFIEAARDLDPVLGYVVLSGYDSEDNLRRAIPLQVYDFISKPLPDRESFEHRLPDWIARTRQRRQETALAGDRQEFVRDLELARIERDVESTASETARQALWETVGSLTTIQALLLNATHVGDSLDRKDPKLTTLLRCLQEARRKAEDAAATTEGYFASAYADRESSPAIVDTCLRHSVDIALRRTKAAERKQAVDLVPLGHDLALSGLTGVDFLLMFVPALMLVLGQSTPGTTVKVRCSPVARLEAAVQEMRWRPYLWINRRNSLSSRPGLALSLQANAPAWEESAVSEWLHRHSTGLADVPSRGLVHGIQKSKGVLGLAVRPKSERLELVMVLPAA